MGTPSGIDQWGKPRRVHGRQGSSIFGLDGWLPSLVALANEGMITLNPMTSSNRVVLLAGATGLVGGHCLARLLATPSVDRIVPVVRRPWPNPEPRVFPLVTELTNLGATASVSARVALCALGTTLKDAGSQAAFRAVDHDAVMSFARWARQGGTEVFGLVSSAGADPNSKNFYLHVKGETEQSLASLGFTCLAILRPSLLLGERRQSRPGESVAKATLPALNPLLFGPTRRYRAISADRVAAALVSLVVRPTPPGRHVWHYDELVERGQD
jgi:uncharacterized protein YbjT (DUF2867 family)